MQSAERYIYIFGIIVIAVGAVNEKIIFYFSQERKSNVYAVAL